MKSETSCVTRIGVMAAIVSLGLPVALFGQHRLDLTSDQADVQAKGRKGQITSSIGIGTSAIEGQRPAPLTLDISAVQLSDTMMGPGRALVFEVTFTNSGKSAIDIPWARRSAERTHEDPAEQHLLLSLETIGIDKQRKSLFLTILTGVPFSRSLLRLEPSETATIREAVQLDFDPVAVLVRPDQTTDVRFALHIRRAGQKSEEVISEPIVMTVAKESK